MGAAAYGVTETITALTGDLIGTDYDSTVIFENEWLADANAVNFLSYFYAEPYDWGFNLIPDAYDFRVPQLRQQCGSYSRNSEFESFSRFQLNDGTTNAFSGDDLEDFTDYSNLNIDFVRVMQGEMAYVQLNAPEKNC